MATFLDYVISPQPIQIVDLKVDRAKLKVKSLTVLQYGHLPGRTIKMRGNQNNFWSFTYISRGRGTYQIEGGPVQELKAGNLFWEWPDTRFNYGPYPGEDWDEQYVCFEGLRVQEWIDSGIFATESVMEVGSDPIWSHKMGAIGAYLESGVPDNADRAAFLLESLVYDLSQTHFINSTTDRNTIKQDLALRILEDLSNHLYQEWNEQEVWERNHVSRSTLRRIVHHYTGYSLNEYIHRLKIAEAKKLLNHTSLQIQEIAQKLGIEDITYFSRLFKKYTGESALSYRKKTTKY